MKNTSKEFTKVISEFDVHKAKLFVEGYPDISTGRSMILKVPKVKGSKDIVILNSNVSEEMPVASPGNVLKGLCSKYRPLKPVYMEEMGNGEQVAFKFAKLNGSNPDEPVVSPVAELEVGGLHFKICVLHIHRYDRIEPTILLEVEIQNEDKDIFYVPFEGGGTFDMFCKLMRRLHNSVDNRILLRKWIFKYHTGYDNVRKLYGSRKELTLIKLEGLAKSVQKKGVNIVGENCLGVFVGWLNWFNSNVSSDVLYEDTVGSVKVKFDYVWKMVIR